MSAEIPEWYRGPAPAIARRQLRIVSPNGEIDDEGGAPVDEATVRHGLDACRAALDEARRERAAP